MDTIQIQQSLTAVTVGDVMKEALHSNSPELMQEGRWN